jgi:hypothetical protein
MGLSRRREAQGGPENGYPDSVEVYKYSMTDSPDSDPESIVSK